MTKVSPPPETAEEEVLSHLEQRGFRIRRRAGLELAAGEVDSFGDTLEWYVAQILRREFAIPAAFLDRIEDVGPDVALFIEDTALRMKDKIVPLFEAALSKRPAWAAVAACRPRRLKDELFQVAGRIFIVNGDPNLARNIGFCLRSFFRSGWSARLLMARRPGKAPPRKAGEAS
jgi:hypothetical protein